MVKAALRRSDLEPNDLLAMAALAAVYGLTGFLSLRLALVEDNVTPLWPPTGIAVVALLLFGTRLWPGIAVAAFIVNLPITPSPLAAAATAAGNTIAPIVVVRILQVVGFRTELDRIRDVITLLVVAPLGMSVSATIGATTMLLSDQISGSAFWQTWSFQQAVVLLAAAAIAAIFRYRLHHVTQQLNIRFDERLAERTRIAQDRACAQRARAELHAALEPTDGVLRGERGRGFLHHLIFA